MQKNIGRSEEKRLLGASLILARETIKSGLEVLIIKDTPKVEVPSGLTKWHEANLPAWSFPGGGRILKGNGELETRSETLQRELREELGLILSLALINKGKVQKTPFLVGQRKSDEINQLGVTSVMFWFDELGRSEINYVNYAEKKGNAIWSKLEQLAVAYAFLMDYQRKFLTKSDHLDNLNYLNLSKEVRPHLYTTAYLWYLDFVNGLDSDLIVSIFNGLNSQTRKFLVAESKKHSVPIVNGAFDENGRALTRKELTAIDAEFLYGPVSK